VALVGACDQDLEKAKATGLAAFKDLAVMLKMSCPDLLDIITPPPTHMAAIKAGISQGVRAIICQKPFCTSLEEAEEATRLAEKAGSNCSSFTRIFGFSRGTGRSNTPWTAGCLVRSCS
jgi:predicted dehydrogenase